MRTLTALLLITALAFSFITVTAQTEATLVPLMGFEPADTNRVWQNNRFFERMQERTGIQFSFLQYDDLAAYHSKLQTLSPTDTNLPAVLFKAGLSPQLAAELHQKGVLVDLAPYLETYAPNFYQLMEAQPEIRRAITLDNGSIPALPYITKTMGQNILWVNREWLDALKMQMPRTIDEFDQMLRAFKTKDPNLNGKQDEIPFSFIGPYELKYMAHAFGLVANDFNLFVEDGTVKFMPFEERFYDFLAWANARFQEGLIDRDAFMTVDNLRRVTDAKGSNRYGAFFAPLPTAVVPMEWTSQYNAMMPLEDNGQSIYRAVSGRVFYGTFALTSACKNIEEMLAWVDTLYTEEGAIMAGVGLEGEDYVMDGDGSWRLLREAGDRMYFAQTLIATDQSAPGISSEDFQKNYTDTTVRKLTEQTESVVKVSVLPFPDLPFTAEQVAKIAPLQAQIGKYLDESIARFVLGEWELTQDSFKAFLDELKTLGVQELVNSFQEMYQNGIRHDGV
ncbi:MAG: extracellular solute-binding protein [Clostridiales bacterium]|nr:extracellular solute-binding protein [Clostridiales bacterium]